MARSLQAYNKTYHEGLDIAMCVRVTNVTNMSCTLNGFLHRRAALVRNGIAACIRKSDIAISGESLKAKWRHTPDGSESSENARVPRREEFREFKSSHRSAPVLHRSRLLTYLGDTWTPRPPRGYHASNGNLGQCVLKGLGDTWTPRPPRCYHALHADLGQYIVDKAMG